MCVDPPDEPAPDLDYSLADEIRYVFSIKHLSWSMTKQTKCPLRPAKTKISQFGYPPRQIRVLAVCLKKVRVLRYSEDFDDQTGRKFRLI